jgi:glucosamine kinase
MQLYLGVDGGGTGCRAAVCDRAGRILGTGTGGPANIASDMEGARDSVLSAAGQALQAAGGGEIGDLVAALGLAGVNAAGVPERFAQALPFRHLRLVTDAVTAVKGALGPRDGIVAALGTGSVFGCQRAGAVRQIGGRGLVLGDEASGAWIGRAILSRALRAVDGLEAETPLLAALVAERDGPDGVVAFSLRARPADFAALAPRVAESGDPAAQAVMAAAVAEVAAAIRALDAGGGLPVVLLGGLAPVFAPRLQGLFPLLPPAGSALDGALLLAREGAG